MPPGREYQQSWWERVKFASEVWATDTARPVNFASIAVPGFSNRRTRVLLSAFTLEISLATLSYTIFVTTRIRNVLAGFDLPFPSRSSGSSARRRSRQPEADEFARQLGNEAVVMHTEKVFCLLAFEVVQPYFALADILVVGQALGALVAVAGALDASYFARLCEFATLMAIDFTRRRAAAIFTAEALIATFLGGGLGIALAFALTQAGCASRRSRSLSVRTSRLPSSVRWWRAAPSSASSRARWPSSSSSRRGCWLRSGEMRLRVVMKAALMFHPQTMALQRVVPRAAALFVAGSALALAEEPPPVTLHAAHMFDVPFLTGEVFVAVERTRRKGRRARRQDALARPVRG